MYRIRPERQVIYWKAGGTARFPIYDLLNLDEDKRREKLLEQALAEAGLLTQSSILRLTT
jgi:hypothetical protein